MYWDKIYFPVRDFRMRFQVIFIVLQLAFWNTCFSDTVHFQINIFMLKMHVFTGKHNEILALRLRITLILFVTVARIEKNLHCWKCLLQRHLSEKHLISWVRLCMMRTWLKMREVTTATNATLHTWFFLCFINWESRKLRV